MADGKPAGGPTPPLEGLLAGLRLALGAGTAVEHHEALTGVADWPAVSGLVAHHRVGALFLNGMRTGGLEAPDPGVARGLVRQRRHEVLAGARQIVAMQRVVGALDAAGVPSLVLKGLPLGQRAYGSPFAKSSVDLDLLVPEDAFAAAARALGAAGWRRTMPSFRETPARMRWYDSVENHHVYARDRIRIELHRRLLANPFLFDPPFDSLYSRALTVEIGMERFRTPGDSDHLLYLACHGMAHYWRRLKWLCDFAALLRAMEGDAVAEAAARSRTERLEHVLAAALGLCREHLQVEAPEAAALVRADSRRARWIAGASRRAWAPRHGLPDLVAEVAMRVVRVFLGSGVRHALREARGLLIGRHDFSRLDLPDRLFWLYPLAWPFLAALRLMHGPGGPRPNAPAVPAAPAGHHEGAREAGHSPPAANGRRRGGG